MLPMWSILGFKSQLEKVSCYFFGRKVSYQAKKCFIKSAFFFAEPFVCFFLELFDHNRVNNLLKELSINTYKNIIKFNGWTKEKY